MKFNRVLFATFVTISGLVLHVMAREESVDQRAGARLAARSAFAAQAGGPEASVLNINNMDLWVQRDGKFPWSFGYTGGAASTYPKGTGGLIFAEGLMWGAKVDDGNLPELRVNGSTYVTGLKAGKAIDAGGNFINPVGSGAGEIPEDQQVWRVRGDWLTADLTADAGSYFGKPTQDVTQADIDSIYVQYEHDWSNWPADKGAPFEDRDGDGLYNSQVDIAGEPGASQTIWLVANDLPYQDGTAVAPDSYGSPAIGIELQLTMWAYAFDADNPLGNVIFKRTRLIYVGRPDGPPNAKLDTVYISQWSDPDLGNFGDDFVGIDTTLSLGYVYNGNTLDDVFALDFGLAVPAGGYDLLQGPITDIDGVPDTLGLTSSGYFGAGSAISDPDLGQYSGALQWFNLMEGFLPRPDYPQQDPWLDNTATATKFPLAGDPVTATGDIDGLVLPPGDRRLLLNSGPFQMALGDTQDIVIANIGALGADNLSSLTLLREYDGVVQSAYDADFNLPNTRPMAMNDSGTMPEDSLITLAVLANDSDADGDPLTIFHFFQGDFGTVARGPGDSTLTYTPQPDFFGLDQFDYVISDVLARDTATVTIAVTAVNDPPVAIADTIATLQADQVTAFLLLNDTDIDDDSLTIASFTQGEHGAVAIDPGDTSVTYTLVTPFAGLDSFTYVIRDIAGAMDTAGVLVLIGTDDPIIIRITDVPDDQGGRAYLSWVRSVAELDGLISQYGIKLQNPDGEWISLGSVAAELAATYIYLAETFGDSTDAGIIWSKFVVTAFTGDIDDPPFYFASPVDSGYSIDNLAPAAPTGLMASVTEELAVALAWNGPVDHDFGFFRVYRQAAADTVATALAETPEPAFTDATAEGGESYDYWVAALDVNGNESGFSQGVSVTVLGVEETSSLPTEFALNQNYPNPFNPATTLRFDLPQAAVVRLVVYDLRGREVARLADGDWPGGYHYVVWDGRGVPSGIFIARLVTPEYAQSIKMLLLK